MGSGEAALIGAGIGVAGGLVLKVIDMRTERERWLRSRRDVVYRDTRLAACDLVTKIAEFVFSTIWFTYKLNDNNRSDWNALQHAYDVEGYKLIAAVKGAQIKLASMDSRLHSVFKPLVDESLRLSTRADVAVAEAAEKFDEAAAEAIDDAKAKSRKDRVLEPVLKVNIEADDFLKELPQRVADLLDEKSAVKRD
jgi:hypothetical protein